MGKIRPIYVMNENGLIIRDKQAVLDGVCDLVGIAGKDEIKVVDFGAWRMDNYRNEDGFLKQFQSVDWYLQRGWEASRREGQLNAERLIECLFFEPWRYPKLGGREHYDVFVVNSDMYDSDTNFVVGLAQEDIGTVISVARFKCLDDESRYECIKTETMHELGHVFGLPAEDRKYRVENNLGKHCTNICVMRQGLAVPRDWIGMSRDRKRYGALCRDCKIDLENYFRR